MCSERNHQLVARILWLWLQAFLCICNILGVFVSVQVGIWRSRTCQKQIQHTQISIRSFAYCLFQTPCQHCLSRRCVWRETTYDQHNNWPCVLSNHSTTVQNNLDPLKACLYSCMYLLSCINWMDKIEHSVYRVHDQSNWRCPNMTETRSIPLRN